MDDQYAALLDKFDNAGVKPWEVMCLSTEDVARRVKISAREIESFRTYFAQHGAEPPLTTIASAAISTQMPELDALLGAGLPRGGVTEVCGAAGAGKTCFCCQMALAAASAVYIASEDSTVLVQRRMQQLAPRYGGAARGAHGVRFVRVRTPAELRVATHQVRRLSPPPELVVLDSVAALVTAGRAFLDEPDIDDTMGLRRLCAELGCAVLVANQVRDRVGLENRPAGPVYEFEQQEGMHGDARLRAALGPEWAARVDARLFLRRTGGPQREAVLVYSKWAAYGALAMQMTDVGLRVAQAPALDAATTPAATQPA